jgi:hypothetical protein
MDAPVTCFKDGKSSKRLLSTARDTSMAPPGRAAPSSTWQSSLRLPPSECRDFLAKDRVSHSPLTTDIHSVGALGRPGFETTMASHRPPG